MSKAAWYGNFGYIPAKDNIEDNISKKEQLQKKFIKMCATKTKDANREKCESRILDNKSYKKNIRSKKSESDELRKIIKSLKKDVDRLKSTNESLKHDNYELKNSNKQKELFIKELKNNINELTCEVEGLKRSNDELQESLSHNIINSLKKEISEIKSENIRLKRNHEAIKGDLRAATKQLQNYQINRTGEYEGNIVRKYRERLEEKEAELNGLKSKYIDASVTVNELSYKIIKKHERFILNKKACLNKSIINDKSESSSDCENIENIVFGIISLNKNAEVVFIDINNKRYDVSKNNNHKTLRSNIGMPVKATINKEENNVFIECIYYNLNENSKSKPLRKTKQIKIRSNSSVKGLVSREFENKKVLIIGSKYKDKYVRVLDNMGAEVSWHEAFSENESRIEDKCSSADVVIVCTSHISHSVIYKIKTLDDYEDNYKYQLLEVDNVNTIIGRVRYSIENQKTMNKAS